MLKSFLIFSFTIISIIGCDEPTVYDIVSDPIDAKNDEDIVWLASNEGYVVRIIYLQPNDIHEVDINNIRKISSEVQDTYKNEMNRHGYIDKTFKFEKNDDLININVIDGSHPSSFYIDNTKEKIFDELTDKQYNDFTHQNYINVFIVGGVSRVVNGILGRGRPFPNIGFGGICILSEKSEVGLFKLMCHEIGHAFSLYHTTDLNRMMNTQSFDTVLSEYEARWLDKHYFFNDDIKVYPELPEIELLRSYKNNEGLINVNLNIKTEKSELYQIVIRDYHTEIVGWKYVEGNDINTDISLNVKYLEKNYIVCMIMNQTGSYVHYELTLDFKK